MSLSARNVAEVIIDSPLESTDRPFHYLVPDNLSGSVAIGSMVIVPFHGRKLLGYVTAFPAEPENRQLKEIIDVIDEEPFFDSRTITLCTWISKRYLCALSQAFRLIVPPGRSRKVKTLLELCAESESGRLEDFSLSTLTGDLKEIVQMISSAGGSIELGTLERRLGKSVRKSISALETRGILRKKYALSEPEASPKTVRYVRLREEAIQDIRLGPVQKEIVSRLIEYGGEAQQGDLLAGRTGGASSLKALEKRGIVEVSEEQISRTGKIFRLCRKTSVHELNLHQATALSAIEREIDRGGHAVFLLEGVTGSGKTEVYINAIERVFKKKKTAIVLVPEISLTPQTLERFESRFPGEVALLHSSLSPGERFDEWRAIHSGRKRIVVGARSALFAPVKNLGLIVIDEEHEPSYKNDQTPRYHAREVAIKRAELSDALVILGSATPSLESLYRAHVNIYRRLELPQRVDGKPFPDIEIVDMRSAGGAGMVPVVSTTLLDALSRTVEAGDQAIVFLNRRGFANFLQCHSCGYVPECSNCEVSMCFHIKGNLLMCHHCSFAVPAPQVCPHCGSSSLKRYGVGTQKVEEEIRRRLPGVELVRMDTDTTRTKNAHWELLERFRSGKAHVLIGTQMIAKGLDIPAVTLVGVINADTALSLPDFRASERTFQLLRQVSGRAGRGLRPGRVIIQTFNPEHPVIRSVSSGSNSFIVSEIEKRREAVYPPFSELINVILTSTHEGSAAQAAERLRKILETDLKGSGTRILGPSPSPLAKIKNHYRWHILLKCADAERLSDRIRLSMRRYNEYSKSFTTDEKVRIYFDVDPVTLL